MNVIDPIEDIIAISNDFSVPYMDKFGVIPEAKGEGLGAGIWHEMLKAYPQVFWRSRANNPINKCPKDLTGFIRSLINSCIYVRSLLLLSWIA